MKSIKFGENVSLLEVKPLKTISNKGGYISFEVMWRFDATIPHGTMISYYLGNQENPYLRFIDTLRTCQNGKNYKDILPREIVTDTVVIPIPIECTSGKYEVSTFIYPVENYELKSEHSKINPNQAFLLEVEILDEIEFNLLQKNKDILKQVDLVITTKCSLRCKNCGAYIPYDKTPYEIEFEQLIKDINNFIEIVDKIETLQVLGGEPLTHKRIADIIQYLVALKKIEHIKIITNGTIVPNQKLVETLKNEKCEVYISHYPIDISKNRTQLLKILKENNIRYQFPEKELIWYDKGKPVRKGQEVEKLKDIYKKCGIPCRTLLNGKFYLCSTSAFLGNLNVINVKNDFADIRIPNKGLRKEYLNSLLDRGYTDGCDYCDWIEYKEIPPAVQVNNKLDLF